MLKLLITLIILLSSLNSYSKILKHVIAPGHVVRIPLAKACSIAGLTTKQLLVEVAGDSLDCMGKKFKLSTLCMRKRPETFPIDFIRVRYDSDLETIYCDFSSQVLFSLECEKKKFWQCENPQKRCMALKPKIAHELTLIRSHAIDQQEKGTKVLYCLFQSSTQKEVEMENDKNFENFLKSL